LSDQFEKLTKCGLVRPVFAMIGRTAGVAAGQVVVEGDAVLLAPTFRPFRLAAKFPITDESSFDMRWGELRRRDGSIAKP
jgi:hypothetical protein